MCGNYCVFLLVQNTKQYTLVDSENIYTRSTVRGCLGPLSLTWDVSGASRGSGTRESLEDDATLDAVPPSLLIEPTAPTARFYLHVGAQTSRPMVELEKDVASEW